MYSAVHASAGLWLAKRLRWPWASFMVGMASHYVLDVIPHGDAGVGEWIAAGPLLRFLGIGVIDIGLAAIVVVSLLRQYRHLPRMVLLAGAIGAIVPDMLNWVGYAVNHLWQLYIPVVSDMLTAQSRFHNFVHARDARDIPLLLGIAYQLFVLALFLVVQLRRPERPGPDERPGR